MWRACRRVWRHVTGWGGQVSLYLLGERTQADGWVGCPLPVARPGFNHLHQVAGHLVTCHLVTVLGSRLSDRQWATHQAVSLWAGVTSIAPATCHLVTDLMSP
eukprot:174197-Prorocentrum_minimum.AAC.1